MVVLNCVVHQNKDESLKVVSINERKDEDAAFTMDLATQGVDFKDIVMKMFNFVDDYSRITSLELTMCFLTTIPDCIAELNLTELDISRNFIVNVPNCLIAGLENLRKLDISRNELRNISLPFKSTKSICDLNISYNNISYIPDWLNDVNCPNLKNLDVSSNNFYNTLKFDAFKKLEKLVMKSCNFKNIRIIYPMTDIKYLSFGNDSQHHLNAIIEVPFGRFSCFNTLLELDISRLGLTALCEEISHLTVLEKLISRNNFLSCLPQNISKLKSLKVLNVSNNELYELPDLRDLQNLTEFYVSNNLLSSIDEVLKLGDLKIVDAYNNYLTDNLEEILGLNLEALDIDQNYYEGDLSSKKYLNQRETLRNLIKDGRKDGQRIEIDDSDKNEMKDEYEYSYNHEFDAVEIEEENWDNYDVDDDLFLMPYQFHTRAPQNVSRSPVLLDPSYYEDSPYDTT